MKRFTDEEIQEFIKNIAKLIDEGWSIAVAKKKVIGSDNAYKGKKVMSHPLYIDLLNHYANIHGHNQEYYLDNNHKKGARILSRPKSSHRVERYN